MKLAGIACYMRLTAAGVKAMDGLIEVGERGSFDALVEEEDERGLWVRARGHEEQRESVFFVKWDYIATIEILGKSS